MNIKKVLVLIVAVIAIGLGMNYFKKNDTNELEVKILDEKNNFASYANELVKNGDPVGLSSNPYDYVKDNEAFNRIVDMGIEAVPVIEKIVQESKNNGLEEYMLVLAAQKILDVELHEIADSKYNFISAKDWCAQYLSLKKDLKDNIDSLIESNDINSIEDYGLLAYPYLVELYKSGNKELEPIIKNMEKSVNNSENLKDILEL